MRIATHNVWRRITAFDDHVTILIAENVANFVIGRHIEGYEIIDRSSAATLTLAEHINDHCRPPVWSETGGWMLVVDQERQGW